MFQDTLVYFEFPHLLFILKGENELLQLNLIIQLCGSITPEVWPTVQNLETYQKIKLPKDVKRHVKEKLTPQIPCPSAVDLIDKLLVLDPNKRLDADQALSHDFFHEDPPPGDLSCLSKNGASFLEYLGQANRARRGLANNYRNVANPNFPARRGPNVMVPGPVPNQQIINQPYQRYRGLPPDQDSSNINDRIF